MNSNELVSKFQELKSKHSELMTEKLKYEAKKEQISNEIMNIQNKYPEYDLTTIESVEKIINDLNLELESELSNINKAFNKLKEVV